MTAVYIFRNLVVFGFIAFYFGNDLLAADAGSKSTGDRQRTVTKEIFTNGVKMANAPTWLTATRVEKVVDRIQYKLEWSTHRINATWYYSKEDFSRAQSLGEFVTAVTITDKNGTSVHLGPRVTDANFDRIFGHEMVHVILAQKYKGSVPKWFEEGLANHYAKAEKVDYKWLAKQPFAIKLTELAHPVRGSQAEVTYRYKASQAIAEMLAKKCDLENLLRISLERKMEDYVKTYCEIKDLNQAFKDWVKKQSGV